MDLSISSSSAAGFHTSSKCGRKTRSACLSVVPTTAMKSLHKYSASAERLRAYKRIIRSKPWFCASRELGNKAVLLSSNCGSNISRNSEAGAYVDMRLVE